MRLAQGALSESLHGHHSSSRYGSLVSYLRRMHSLAQLGHAAVIAAALLTGSATPVHASGDERRSREHHEFERLLGLMVPLAREVLGSPNREALEANIEEQLFSGLFSDFIVKSMPMVTRRSETDAMDVDEFVTAVERLGADRATTRRALRLSQISTRLAQASVGDESIEDVGASLRVDLSDFLYDIEVPVEIRAAAYADLESAICMVTLAYAVAVNAEAAPWVIAELVERWLAGQVKSLPVLVVLARERGAESEDVLSDELMLPYFEEMLMQEGLPDLAAARRRTEIMVARLHAIAEHASRQPDGVWPKSESDG